MGAPMKKILALLAVVLIAAVAVVINDPGEVSVTGDSGDAPAAVDSGDLSALPPIELIATQYGDDKGPNNCNAWVEDSTYWDFGWNFNHADIGFDKDDVGGLNSSVAPTPSGTVHNSEPTKAQLDPGWNYWWEGTADSTKLNATLLILKSNVTEGSPCDNAIFFTLSGDFIDGPDTWSVDVFTTT